MHGERGHGGGGGEGDTAGGKRGHMGVWSLVLTGHPGKGVPGSALTTGFPRGRGWLQWVPPHEATRMWVTSHAHTAPKLALPQWLPAPSTAWHPRHSTPRLGQVAAVATAPSCWALLLAHCLNPPPTALSLARACSMARHGTARHCLPPGPSIPLGPGPCPLRVFTHLAACPPPPACSQDWGQRREFGGSAEGAPGGKHPSQWGQGFLLLPP